MPATMNRWLGPLRLYPTLSFATNPGMQVGVQPTQRSGFLLKLVDACCRGRKLRGRQAYRFRAFTLLRPQLA